ncbi:MAG: nuclear transport factor 2 family protein [Microthrixaceae bacterium]
MYKATVRVLLRHGLRKLNAGDARFILRLAHPDAVLVFPGDNSYSTMYRPVVRSAGAHATHRGSEELRGFVERFIANGVEFVADDILVNGLPHRTRVAVRGRTRIPGPAGKAMDEYNNRIVAYITITWGRVTSWEDYEDTQRIADWDAAREPGDESGSVGTAGM